MYLTPPLYKGRLGGVEIYALIQHDSRGKMLELLRRSLPHPSPPLIKGREPENTKAINKSISLDRDLAPPLSKGRLGGVKIHALIQDDWHGKTLELWRRSDRKSVV